MQPNLHTSAPLTEEHYQTINAVLEGCSMIDELLHKCQSAGLNVDAQAKQNQQRKQLASGIKAAFFPDRP